jgi:hypothetical protein
MTSEGNNYLLLIAIYPACKDSWSFVSTQCEESYSDIKQFCSVVSNIGIPISFVLQERI